VNEIATTPAGDEEMSPPLHVNFERAGVAYTPAQIRKAYGFATLSGTGVGQTIAVVEVYGSPTIQQDLNTFSKQFNLPTATVQVVNLGRVATNGGWALETSLDVEWAHAIAPGAGLLEVVAKSAATSDLLAAVDYAAQHASVVSMSWGGTEFPSEVSLNAHFNVPGVTFVAASGDSGAGAEWPAAAPNVLAVGGTTLKLDASGNRLSETGWVDSGGGQSAFIREPAYQQSWQSSGYRQLPDVSYDADPNTGVQVYDSTPYQRYSGWFVVGGTSAGTPQWAALIALVNAAGAKPLSAANTALYTLVSPRR